MINQTAQKRNVPEETNAHGPSLAAHYDAARSFAATVRRARFGIEAAASDGQHLGNAITRLGHIEAILLQPLRLALLGEFNSGKTTLANLLIGNAPLPTMQLSNTCIPTHIVYNDEPVVSATLANGQTERVTVQTAHPPDGTKRINVGLPVSNLRCCEIVDFPGFSDPWLAFSGIDAASHPVDVAIWCTFSTQAWKESEAVAWRLLPTRFRRNAIMAVTSKDLLQEDQAAKVLARLHKTIGDEFREVLLISSLQARKSLDEAGRITNVALRKQSGIAELQRTIDDILSEVICRRLEKAKHLTNRIAQSALQKIG